MKTKILLLAGLVILALCITLDASNLTPAANAIPQISCSIGSTSVPCEGEEPEANEPPENDPNIVVPE